MENFIFSINATIPIFLIMLLGYILKRIGFLTEEFATAMNKYVFVVALPVMLFQDIASSDVSKEMNVKFFLFCLISTISMFLIVWLIARITLRDKTMVGAFAQAASRGSAAILGVAFVENICGNIGSAPLMIVAAVPFFNIMSVIILVCNADSDEKNYGKIKGSIINIAKNPIIIGILLGVLWSLFKHPIPAIPAKTIDYISRSATPMALLAIGAGFNVNEALVRLKPAMGATFIKLIGLPLMYLPIAFKLGFTGSEIVSILVMLASPSTVSCYVMAKGMNNDGILTSNIIVLTTLLSSLTLTLWIFILKTLGCV